MLKLNNIGADAALAHRVAIRYDMIELSFHWTLCKTLVVIGSFVELIHKTSTDGPVKRI